MRLALPMRAAVLPAALLLALAGGTPAHADTPYAPLPPHNPYAGPDGTATMHGDTGSSDATPLPGPKAGPLASDRVALQSACPTVLVGSDGYPVALCTTIFGLTPTVHLLDPADGGSVAELPLAKGSLLGGVYAYLDDENRLVAVDGDRNLLRIGHRRDAAGRWELYVDRSLSLAGAVPAGDAVTGVSPDWQGRVWFATGGGVVGTADDRTGTVRALALPAGEKVANSISTAPEGTAVATTHATYLLTAAADGTPRIAWRRPYDRGPGRKPGQLSWGTGSTPTFFGPRTGTDYVTVVDNAAPTVNLLVYRASDGSQVCSVPVLKAGGSGSENSPVAAGNTVFVASTYGYPYPKLPDDAGPSVPSSGRFRGGFSRVDVRPDGSGCDLAWDNKVRSAAVPRLSTADGLIHTVLRNPVIPGTEATSVLDPYYYAEVDPRTGAVVRTEYTGAGFLFDTLQMVGSIAPGGVVYQGTTTGVLRITADE
ncbi:hypothetical protein [Streptomyces sp. CB01881]|uniref:hypothetical protein n=1 Tax=Streptomyces sp. CB01881 TaxID=2078691 RepID=UPI000CDBD09F|nr:hypothetical protein [Streptomyces sp. CB01881]AUY49857.1 hypothetical protein C2142_14005 [Streptomyces sp. CB01881]TYC73248.1 hypothetical protein EH183_13995 [Streptomyces sp. CB01881]